MPQIVNVVTQSGSIYEIEVETVMVRRMSNAQESTPTPRQGPDGEWKAAHSIVVMDDGFSRNLLIMWDDKGHATRTSPIVVITPNLLPVVDGHGVMFKEVR